VFSLARINKNGDYILSSKDKTNIANDLPLVTNPEAIVSLHKPRRYFESDEHAEESVYQTLIIT
jgi:hypothetical protein